MLVTAACEPTTFTSPVEPTATPLVPGAPAPTSTPAPPATGCDGSSFPGDPAFAVLVCDYQAALIGALADGVDVSAELRSSVTDAIAAWVTDPSGAADILRAAIDEIQALRQVLTPTLTDVTDDLFSCIEAASGWLQEATNRVEIGGVPIPELDGWRTAFDDAAALAESGDVAGATRLLCDLATTMESVLVQT